MPNPDIFLLPIWPRILQCNAKDRIPLPAELFAGSMPPHGRKVNRQWVAEASLLASFFRYGAAISSSRFFSISYCDAVSGLKSACSPTQSYK